MGEIKAGPAVLIEFDRELKGLAPGFVRQMVVMRREDSPDFVVQFEMLLAKGVSRMEAAQDPRAAAKRFWEVLSEQMTCLEDTDAGLRGAGARVADDEGNGGGGGGGVGPGAV